MKLKNSERSFGLCLHRTLPSNVQSSELMVGETFALTLPAGWSARHSLKIGIKVRDYS
jgi:hypothetical protein